MTVKSMRVADLVPGLIETHGSTPDWMPAQSQGGTNGIDDPAPAAPSLMSVSVRSMSVSKDAAGDNPDQDD